MNSIKLSFIIPIFNVEQYIEKCLTSIYNQCVSEDLFEVVIINDGSKDSSGEIVNKFRLLHKNIKYFEIENSGVSKARNLGIANSSGEYLSFIDGDDYIISGSVKYFLSKGYSSSKQDIIIARSFTNQKELYHWPKLNLNLSYSGYELLMKNYFRGSVCGTFISRELILRNNILFPEEVILSEDTIYITLVMINVISVSFCDIPMYYVRERVGSASRMYSCEKLFAFSKNIDFLLLYKMNSRLTEEQKQLFDFLMYNIISNATSYAIRLKYYNISKVYEFLRISNVRPLYQLNWKICILNNSYYLYFLLNLLSCKVHPLK